MATRQSRISAALLAALATLAVASTGVAKDGVPDGKGGTCITVAGGGGSSWDICDDANTSNGLPAGGSCSSGVAGSGAAIDDAETTTGGGDAFDLASLLFVNNVQVAGLATQAGNSVSFASSASGGLNRQLRYDVLTTEATTRVVLTLTNTTGAPISPTVNYVGNFGSDSGTGIDGSFTGDTAFTVADEWVVTSDGAGGDGTQGNDDPVNTTVLFGGTNTPPSTPTSATLAAFGCSGTEGYNVAFSPVVPANGAVTFLFFQRLSDTAAIALPAALEFTNITATSPLLAGLTPAELGRLANFAFAPVGPVTPPPPIPMLSRNVLVLLGVVLALVGLIGVRLHASRG